MESDREWLTTVQLAEWLQIEARTIESWRYHRTGPRWHKVGHAVRYRRRDVEKWLTTQAA